MNGELEEWITLRYMAREEKTSDCVLMFNAQVRYVSEIMGLDPARGVCVYRKIP
jgi:hypothetical protein